MSIDVFAVGNAIVDLQLEVPDSFLDRLGVEKGMMTLVEPDRQIDVLATLAEHKVHRSSGGSACNTVVGVVDLGGSGAYACRTGNDEMGHFYVEELRGLGIEVPSPAGEGSTGTSVILITPDAQRTMLTDLGVSATLSPDDLPVETIARAKYCYVEGYLFPGEPTRQAALRAVEIAYESDVKVALTLSDPFVVGACRDLLWELIEGPVDLLFANLEEARALTGKTDPIDCAQAVHAHATNVALTLGADGSILMHGDKAHPIEGVSVNAVDTTGAGDMYAAGVLYGLTHELGWAEAGRLGSHAAARIVAQLGARLPRPFTREEIVAMENW